LDEPNILITLNSSNQIQAHSLFISQDEAGHDRNKQDDAQAIKREEDVEDVFERPLKGRVGLIDDKDPDRLLLEGPSFELEQCWSIDLNELDGVRSMFDEEDEEEDEAGGEKDAKTKLSSCLFLPIWPSSEQVGVKRGLSSMMADETNLAFNQAELWPQFLFIVCKCHVLIFSFEHVNVLPFSIVYDRAFLNLTASSLEMGSTATQTKSQTTNTEQQFQDKRIDLRLKPKLLHSIKLIGTRPSDSLFNMLFLTNRIHLIQAKNFTNFGLLATISNQGHLLVFKLTSPKLLGPNHKDNLYQQLLIDSLRGASLLRDELNRMQTLEMELKEEIGKFETQLGNIEGGLGGHEELLTRRDERTKAGQSKSELNQQTMDMLEVKTVLKPHKSVGKLFELDVSWPCLVMTVFKVIIVSTVDECQLQAPLQEHIEQFDQQVAATSMRPKIRRVLIENEQQAHLERIFQKSTGFEPNQSWPTSTTGNISIELDSEPTLDDDHQLQTGPGSQRAQLKVPIVLEDFKVGQLKVYLVCWLPFADQFTSFVHQLVPQINHQLKQSEHKFIKRELPVKLLSSFRLISAEEDSPLKSGKTLSFEGSFSFEKSLFWLQGLLEVSIKDIISTSQTINTKTTLVFRSSSRRETLHVELATNNLLFATNDQQSLELIKQHVMKQATNESIQLKPCTN
jgi:hypothetical protein